MNVPDIFFSYTHEDRARIAPIVRELEARGWSVFWDRRIPTGKTWLSHIGSKLEHARCVVVAWSEHSIKSKWVIKEAGIGEYRDVLMPACIDPVSPPHGFRDIHAADLSSWLPGRVSPEFDNFLVDLSVMLDSPLMEPVPTSNMDLGRHPAAERHPAGLQSNGPSRQEDRGISNKQLFFSGLLGCLLNLFVVMYIISPLLKRSNINFYNDDATAITLFILFIIISFICWLTGYSVLLNYYHHIASNLGKMTYIIAMIVDFPSTTLALMIFINCSPWSRRPIIEIFNPEVIYPSLIISAILILPTKLALFLANKYISSITIWITEFISIFRNQ